MNPNAQSGAPDTPGGFVPRNRLAPILEGLDRARFAEHVNRAQNELDRIAPALATGLDADVRALAAQCRGEEMEVFEHARAIGLAALTVVEGARLAGLPMLAEASAGLWEMIDALSSRGVWHSEALRVHADSLAALSSLADETPEAATILSELRRLRAAVGASTP